MNMKKLLGFLVLVLVLTFAYKSPAPTFTNMFSNSQHPETTQPFTNVVKAIGDNYYATPSFVTATLANLINPLVFYTNIVVLDAGRGLDSNTNLWICRADPLRYPVASVNALNKSLLPGWTGWIKAGVYTDKVTNCLCNYYLEKDATVYFSFLNAVNTILGYGNVNFYQLDSTTNYTEAFSIVNAASVALINNGIVNLTLKSVTNSINGIDLGSGTLIERSSSKILILGDTEIDGGGHIILTGFATDEIYYGPVSSLIVDNGTFTAPLCEIISDAFPNIAFSGVVYWNVGRTVDTLGEGFENDFQWFGPGNFYMLGNPQFDQTFQTDGSVTVKGSYQVIP